MLVAYKAVPIFQSTKNRLLAALTEESHHRVLPYLELVSLPLGKPLFEPGTQQNYVYFPTTALISLLQILENGQSAEIAVVGCEGIVGISLFMGVDRVPQRAVVQGAGEVLQMKVRAMQAEFERGGRFQQVLLRYTMSLITQVSQTAVCNRVHSLDQQLCRWLLLSHDRVRDNNLIMTQEMISNMLGVRREGVSVAAGQLQKDGIINYTRGHITIIDRARLEARVCECYKIVKAETDRLLEKD